jgi:hypothetical protein
VVEEALDLIGGVQDIIKPGDLVLVNPSWVAPPVEMNLILAGKDLVAVDGGCARLIGYKPRKILLTVNGGAPCRRMWLQKVSSLWDYACRRTNPSATSKAVHPTTHWWSNPSSANAPRSKSMSMI